jgi:hypothetical protein
MYCTFYSDNPQLAKNRTRFDIAAGETYCKSHSQLDFQYYKSPPLLTALKYNTGSNGYLKVKDMSKPTKMFDTMTKARVKSLY